MRRTLRESRIPFSRTLQEALSQVLQAAALSRYRRQPTKMCIYLQVRNLLILHSYDSFFPFPISASVRAGQGRGRQQSLGRHDSEAKGRLPEMKMKQIWSHSHSTSSTSPEKFVIISRQPISISQQWLVTIHLARPLQEDVQAEKQLFLDHLKVRVPLRSLRQNNKNTMR